MYALGVAASPVAIATVLVMLSCRHGSTHAVSFAAGWTTGVAICALGFMLIVDGLDATDSHPPWLGLVDAVVGASFLAVAARLWLQPRPPGSPPWLDVVDRFTSVRAASFGAFLAGANPKVVALSLGAALSLADAQASLPASLATVALFTVIGALGVVVPTAACVALPGHGAAPLAAFRGWLARYERTVLILLALAIGGFFLRDGLTMLMS